MRLASAIAAVLVLASTGQSEVRRLRLETTALLADASRGRIYAATPGTGPLGNRVVTILPEEVLVAASPLGAFVGSEPNVLGMDADATVLYVGLAGSGTITRVRLDSFERDLTFPLSRGPFSGLSIAASIAVMPGAPETVAIAQTEGSFANITAIYDGGVRRPSIRTGFDVVGALAFLADPARLYGVSGRNFYRWNVDGSGLPLGDSTEGLFPDGVDDLEGDWDRLVTNAGVAIAPEGPFGATVLGSFSVQDSYVTRARGPVEASLARDRVYYVHQFSDLRTMLLTYRRSTFVQLDALPLPVINGTVHSLAAWGSDGVALGTTTGDVFLVGTGFAPCTSDANCDDGDVCTSDVCREGQCTNAEVSCPITVCGAATCTHDRGCIVTTPMYGTPCDDDGDPCTDDTCGVEGCEHRTRSPGSQCDDDGDACTVGVCDVDGGCVYQLPEPTDEAYFLCSLYNVRAALRREPLCADRCWSRLNAALGELEVATRDAFQRFYGSENECRAILSVAVQRARRLSRIAQRLRKRRLLQPTELGVALVQESREVVGQLRTAIRTICPLVVGEAQSHESVQ